METKKEGSENGNECVGCGGETSAFFSPSLGWYCGDCKERWEREGGNQ